MPKSLLRFATVFLCAIGLWGGLLVPGTTSQVQALESVRDDVVITTLDNGLTVVLAPRDWFCRVYCRGLDWGGFCPGTTRVEWHRPFL